MGIENRFNNSGLVGVIELTIDPGALTNGRTTGSTTVAVDGVKAGDLVIPFETSQGNQVMNVGAEIAEDGQFDLTSVTAWTATVNPASQVFRLLVFRPSGALPTKIKES